jgi:hypothetical protein
VVRLEERPVLCWVRLGPPPDLQPVDDALKRDIQSGLRIRLARAEVFNCVLKSPLSVSQRRNAKPPTQPHVTCGRASLADATFVTSDGEAEVFLFTLAVDTASAGFRTRPSYFTTVAGSRLIQVGASSVLVAGLTSFIIPPDRALTRLDVQFVGFVFGVSGSSPAISDVTNAVRETWHVDWIGVEG